jgi:hypothetical protein
VIARLRPGTPCEGAGPSAPRGRYVSAAGAAPTPDGSPRPMHDERKHVGRPGTPQGGTGDRDGPPRDRGVHHEQHARHPDDRRRGGLQCVPPVRRLLRGGRVRWRSVPRPRATASRAGGRRRPGAWRPPRPRPAAGPRRATRPRRGGPASRPSSRSGRSRPPRAVPVRRTPGKPGTRGALGTAGRRGCRPGRPPTPGRRRARGPGRRRRPGREGCDRGRRRPRPATSSEAPTRASGHAAPGVRP